MPIIADFLTKLVLVSDIAVLLLILHSILIAAGVKHKTFEVWNFIGRKALWFGLAVSLVSMLVLLGYTPYGSLRVMLVPTYCNVPTGCFVRCCSLEERTI
jgi:hypothetical protein